MPVTACRRCGARMEVDPELCSVCAGPLCFDCWERVGHCGDAVHPGQDERDRRQQEYYRTLGYPIPRE